MTHWRESAVVSAAAMVLVTTLTLMASPIDRIGEKLEDVSLTTLEGKAQDLLSLHTEEIFVIAYTGVGCPISSGYAPRLEKLHKKYGKKGVQFVGINANPHDTLEKIAAENKELGITFPLLKDANQKLTEQLDVKTTTEAFVIDKDRMIRYRGMIDDQYALGKKRSKPKHDYLEEAIKAVLDGEEPETTRTVAPGCLITKTYEKSASPEITYASHVAKILQDNCQKCHRPGQIGPFPLTSYEEARGWSAMIYSVVEEGRMPPWNAAHDFDGLFANQRSLTADDKKAVLAWIDSGMPRGNPDDEPQEKKWSKHWRIGKPDKVYKMSRPYKVPAEGVVEYQYFRIPTHFNEDKWIRAMEASPGAPEVVHHILVFVKDPTAPLDRQRIGLEDGYLCATVPGDTPAIFPPGAAKRLPARAEIWFQVHYTTNGKKYRDRCSIALQFVEENEVQREVRTRGIYNFDFEIPAGADNYEVVANHTLEEPIELLGLYPHMHFRGKDWKFVAHFPDGRKQDLLSVPKYDYNWQESYVLKKPMKLPGGTRIEGIAHFDNSAKNFNNPDPTVAVRFGEQSWDEMMIGYFDYVTPPGGAD